MNKFVIKKMISRFSKDLADYIFKNLNAGEKAEVKKFLDNNPDKDKAYAVWMLYMLESQRRRMNPNFVRAVSEYLDKHPKCELAVVTVPSKTKKIELHDADGGEVLLFDTNQGEDIKLWKNQVSVTKEVTENDKEVPTLEVSIAIPEAIKKLTFKDKVRIFFNKLKRKIFYSRKNRWRDKSKKGIYSGKFRSK
ncbi:hypothetical protein J6W34_07160 [bacterium]|nr:hypothetical protein [bacterium]